MPTDSSYLQVSDETLLRLVARQNSAAYETFYDRHTTAVYSLILRIIRQPTRAEELLQETFWQVWRNAATYRGEGAALAWLLRIARNRALDELRRQKVRPQVAEPLGEGITQAEQIERAVTQYASPSNVVETTVARRWNQHLSLAL